MTTGRYIALEGAEGTGKSTHAARLAALLGAVLTRETGGTDVGIRIRAILHDTSLTHLSHRAEALLTAADRAQHIDEIRQINQWAIHARWPDLVVLIDTPAEVLERRMRGRQLDRFEREGDDFHARVRDGFRTMAAEDPERWVVIDGAAGMDEVGANIRRCVTERLGL